VKERKEKGRIYLGKKVLAFIYFRSVTKNGTYNPNFKEISDEK